MTYFEHQPPMAIDLTLEDANRWQGELGKVLPWVKWVVLDWSGTVSDDLVPVYRADMRLLGSKEPAYTFDQWLVVTTRISSVIEFMRAHGIQGSSEILMARFKTVLNEVIAEGFVPEMYPYIPDTLRQLKAGGKKLAVISSHPAENLVQEAERYGLSGFFDLLTGGVMDKAQALSALCQSEGLDPSRVLYAGDTIFDIQAAKKAGVIAAAVCSGYHPRKILQREWPDLLLINAAELLDK